MKEVIGVTIVAFFEPSLLNPEGSNFAGNPAKATALLRMSLALKCLGNLPEFPTATL